MKDNSLTRWTEYQVDFYRPLYLMVDSTKMPQRLSAVQPSNETQPILDKQLWSAWPGPALYWTRRICQNK